MPTPSLAFLIRFTDKVLHLLPIDRVGKITDMVNSCRNVSGTEGLLYGDYDPLLQMLSKFLAIGKFEESRTCSSCEAGSFCLNAMQSSISEK